MINDMVHWRSHSAIMFNCLIIFFVIVMFLICWSFKLNFAQLGWFGFSHCDVKLSRYFETVKDPLSWKCVKSFRFSADHLLKTISCSLKKMIPLQLINDQAITMIKLLTVNTVQSICFQAFQQYTSGPNNNLMTIKKKKTVLSEDDHLAPVLLVLPRFTRPSCDSSEAKNGKNSLELAQLWSWLNPLLFPLTLLVAIGDCPVKHCCSSLTGFTGRTAMLRTYLA